MTREEAKQKVFLHIGMDAIEHYSSGFVDGVWILRTDVINFIDQIYDEHDLEMKAKDEEIERLKEFEEMVEWMELNSNRSLCDYYNNKDNS